MAVAIFGLVVFAGWVLGIPGLTTLYVPGPTVKTNAAIALTAGGVANLLLMGARGRSVWIYAGWALAALQAIIGGLTLSEHVIGWDLGIDQLIATESEGAYATMSPNRMGPPASIANLLLGVALLLTHRTSRWARTVSAALPVATCVLAFLPLTGYAYGVTQLFGVARYTGIALSTAVALLLLSLAVIGAHPQRGLAALICRRDEVGTLARGMLPVAVLLPLGMGWLLSQSLRIGAIEGTFAVSVMSLVLITGLAALIWRTGNQLASSLDARLTTERALSESERSLRESDRQKTEFLATLSHELRNPLAPIRFALELLDSPPPGSVRARQTIARQVHHLTRLIDDLLDLTRITRNKLELHLATVEVSVVLNDAVDAVRGELLAAHHTLDLQLPSEPVWMNVDPDRVVQIITNLLNNAVRYTDSGGTITVGALVSETHVEMFVRDTGAGITAEDLGRVFDRFVQVGSSRHGGLGIGLALVQGLAELQGGSVEARSDGLGKGAEFRVRLPRAAAPSEAPRATADPVLSAPLRILVVDDNVDATDMLHAILVSRQHEVVVAHSAEEAMSRTQTFRPQVGLLDIGMPGMSGYELATELRRNPATAEMFLVAITGWGQDEDRRRALASGFDAHMTKPANPDALLGLIATHFPHPDGSERST